MQSKFSSRWTVASAIISVVDNYRVSIATDADGLRKGFLKRIEGDAKKSTLKGRYIQFDAYGQLIAILRAQLTIPLDMRDDFIAKGIDKELGLAIKDRAFDEKKPVFAKGHPDYKTPKKKEEPKKVEEPKERTDIEDAFGRALGPFGEPVEEAEEEVLEEEVAEEVIEEPIEEVIEAVVEEPVQPAPVVEPEPVEDNPEVIGPLINEIAPPPGSLQAQASPEPRARVRAPYPDNIETPNLTEVEVINLLRDNGGEITFMAIVQDVIELSREELQEYLAEEAA